MTYVLLPVVSVLAASPGVAMPSILFSESITLALVFLPDVTSKNMSSLSLVIFDPVSTVTSDLYNFSLCFNEYVPAASFIIFSVLPPLMSFTLSYTTGSPSLST